MYKDITPVKTLRTSHEYDKLAVQEKTLTLNITAAEKKIGALNKEINAMPANDKGRAPRIKTLAKWRESWTYQTETRKKLRERMARMREQQKFS
jgi:hypothetical protein